MLTLQNIQNPQVEGLKIIFCNFPLVYLYAISTNLIRISHQNIQILLNVINFLLLLVVFIWQNI